VHCNTSELRSRLIAAPLPKSSSAVFSPRTEFACAEGRSSFGAGKEPPADHLGQPSRAVNLAGFDAPGNDDFPALCILGPHKFANTSYRRHPAMILIVVPDPDPFFIENPKVDPRERPALSALQLPEPLVRDVETARHRDGEDAPRKILHRAAQPTDAAAANPRDLRFRCEVNKDGHACNPLVLQLIDSSQFSGLVWQHTK